jgi:cytochrome P450
MKLARQYGPIFRLHVGPRRFTVVSGFDLADELCDEERFDKMLGQGLINARAREGARRVRQSRMIQRDKQPAIAIPTEMEDSR